jgi:hypothetical protein
MGENARIADKLIEFTRPERIQFGAKRGHPPSVQAVVLESSFSSARDEPGIGEHAQVLRDRRPAHGEIAGQLGHRLLTGPQQLQQAAAIGLRDRSHQVSHLNTLASANALSKRLLPVKVMTAGYPSDAADDAIQANIVSAVTESRDGVPGAATVPAGSKRASLTAATGPD